MATLQHRSAFNLRGCQPIGGQALQPTSSPCDGAVLENIYEQVRQAAKDYKWEAERTTLRAKLTYNCPKVGDAVRWDASIGGYNLAYAMYDTNNPYDQEHLIEVVGIVESVSVTCDGSGSELDTDGVETNAVIVLSGKISFDKLTPESYLSNGKVYYLWDRKAPSHLSLGNNVVRDFNEPVISKPLFVATGETSGLVLNYRPMTGSPTGGRPQTEKYDIKITKTSAQGGGWLVRVENSGGIASRSPLVAQIDYNKRLGPQDSLASGEIHTMFKNIGILHNKTVALVTDEDALEYYTEFYVTKNSEFGEGGNISDHINNGINGNGQITVTLKSNTSGTQSASLLKSLIPFQTANTVARFPNIKIKGECGYASKEGAISETEDSTGTTGVSNNDLTIPDKVVSPGGASTAYSFEGVIFEIELDRSTGFIDDQGLDTGEDYIEMAEELYFKIESPSLTEPIINKFFLDVTQPAVEIIPVNEAGEGLTQENVTISIINKDGTELHKNNWAKRIKSAMFMCDSEQCCTDETIQVDVMNQGETNPDAKLSDLLTTDSIFMTTGQNGSISTEPKLYTLHPDRTIQLTGNVSGDALIATFKNARENTKFCYPDNIRYGTQPSFMALYFNEARGDTLGARTAKDYDPRYIAIEIGGQDTLDGSVVTLTLNVGQENECCISFTFEGSVEGTHFTFRELYESGKIKTRSSNSDLLFGIGQVGGE